MDARAIASGGLTAALAGAYGGPLPVHDGRDGTGAFTVTVGPDGLPSAVRVHADWRRRVAPESVGAAVLEAAARASADQLAAVASATAPERVTAFVGAMSESAVPDLGVYEAEHRARANGSGAPGTAIGGGNGPVLVLTPDGLAVCEVGPEWAARQTAARLMEALNGALRTARADLDRERGRYAASLSPPLLEALADLARTLKEPR